MSTRSIIALHESDAYTYIYCHWDGNPENNGVILKESYTDINKIKELLALGSLSILGSEIGTKHNFSSHALKATDANGNYTYDENNNPIYIDPSSVKSCLAYGRDRGEANVSAKTAHSLEELMEKSKCSGADYVYIFDNETWICFKLEGTKKIPTPIPN